MLRDFKRNFKGAFVKELLVSPDSSPAEHVEALMVPDITQGALKLLVLEAKFCVEVVNEVANLTDNFMNFGMNSLDYFVLFVLLLFLDAELAFNVLLSFLNDSVEDFLVDELFDNLIK